MDNEKAIIIFNIVGKNTSVDLEVPLDNTAYELGIDTTDIKNCYLKAEKPVALLRGNKTLREFGIRNGSIINYTE